jgi:hypothetical protein
VDIQPPTLRARLVLDIAAELAATDPFKRKMTVRFAGAVPEVVLSNSSTPDGIADVASGKVTLATINPSAALTIAYLGHPPFGTPQPVRTIAVMPSADGLVFAMHPRTGVQSLEDLASAKGPLTIALRGEPEHSLQFMMDDVLAATGQSRASLKARGIILERRGGIPYPTSPKFRELVAGKLDGIFDEGADEWMADVLEAGMNVFGVGEAAMTRLEALGYRRRILAGGMLTLDFSGWAIFVHADAADDLVEMICAALVARDATVTSRNTPDAPYDVPLHPAAERFWRSRGEI